MLIQCQGCAAKYFLPEDKVPEKPIKVRCPKCKAVFTLVPRAEPVAAKNVVGEPTAPQSAIPPLEPAEQVMPEPAAAAAPQAPDVPRAPKIPEAPPEPEPEKKPAASKARGRGKEDRAKRLARVLVSDILCYNQEKRDQAIKDGNLMTVLGEEIKKSWELYKEQVGPEVASSTNYFKEALNEILADGQEVF